MITWAAKDQADVRVYGIDWSPALQGGDTIASVAFAKTFGTATFADQTETDAFTYVTVSGGNNGCSNKFTAELTTASGKVLNEVIWLPIVSAACMDYQPSSTTKRTIVQMAFEDAGLPGYEFSATPEEISSAIRRLDAMMREWPCGQQLGYNFPTAIGESDPDDPVLVPDWAVSALHGKLAVKLAPGLGKTLSSESKVATSTAYGLMLSRLPIPQMQLPRSTPRGAGNRYWGLWQPYVVQTSCCG